MDITDRSDIVLVSASWTACAGLVLGKAPLDTDFLVNTAVDHPGERICL